MKLSALRLFNVKRFANRGVAIEGIGDGVNVLCAANEFGKSTSFEALHALFFQPYSGTPKDVRNLQPYSGGSPVIEADVEIPDGRFRITKQYYSGRSARIVDLATGRLVAQADEAEAFIRGLIQGGPSGPAGLLWVRQGITEFERPGRSDDGEREVRADLLESVQSEVEAVTGGRRMAEVLSRTEAELDLLVTDKGRPRAGGKWAEAIDVEAKLAATERKLGADVAALREALDARAGKTKRLAELDEPEEADVRRRAVAVAEKIFEDARAVGEKLRTAEAELRSVSERRASALKVLTDFRAAAERGHALREGLAEADGRRAAVAEKRRDVAKAIETRKLAVEAAEAEERTAREQLSRFDAAMRAREASARLVEVTQTLAKAEAVRQSLEAAEADLAAARLSDEAVDELQALELEIVRLRAARDAIRPSVAVRYLSASAPQIVMGGAPLEEGEERGYDAEAVLAVPGIGSVTLRSNRPAGDDDRLEKTEERHRALLKSLGVDSLAAARARQSRARQAEADVRDYSGRLDVLAPDGLAKLREEVAAHGGDRAEVLELKEDPVAIRAALVAAEAKRGTARLALVEAEPMRASADEAFITVETDIASRRAELAAVEALTGAAAGQVEREASLAKALADLDDELAGTEARTATLRAAAVDLESAEAALKRARSVVAAAESEAAMLSNAIAGLNGRIGAYADDAVEEAWRETAEALEAARMRALAFEREVRVLQTLKSALETARSKARELYLKPVMTELRPLLDLLLDDVTIAFDHKTLLPETIQRNGLEEKVGNLSGGMREQLSILTRLAFARLLARDGRPAPVILDDALVYSDDDRIERMFDALHRQSRDLQIIVFTCRQRAFSRLGGHVLQMTEWRPNS